MLAGIYVKFLWDAWYHVCYHVDVTLKVEMVLTWWDAKAASKLDPVGVSVVVTSWIYQPVFVMAFFVHESATKKKNTKKHAFPDTFHEPYWLFNDGILIKVYVS